MNQRKVFKILGLMVLVMLLMMMLKQTGVQADKKPPAVMAEKGITLDISRKFYKSQVIKKFIDDLSKYPKSFLQLHMTDNQNLAVEMSVVGQTTEKKRYLSRRTMDKHANQSPFSFEKGAGRFGCLRALKKCCSNPRGRGSCPHASYSGPFESQ